MPAAAFASIALVEGRFTQAAESALQLVMNLVGIVIAAAVVLLRFRRTTRGEGQRRLPNG